MPWEKCPICRGVGFWDRFDPRGRWLGKVRCTACEGTGRILVVYNPGRGQRDGRQVPDKVSGGP